METRFDALRSLLDSIRDHSMYAQQGSAETHAPEALYAKLNKRVTACEDLFVVAVDGVLRRVLVVWQLALHSRSTYKRWCVPHSEEHGFGFVFSLVVSSSLRSICWSCVSTNHSVT